MRLRMTGRNLAGRCGHRPLHFRINFVLFVYRTARRSTPLPPLPGRGSDPTAAGGGVKGGERVAAVGVQRSRSVGKAHTGHRNRTPAPLNRPLLIQFVSLRVGYSFNCTCLLDN